jgi:hypothetical protein
VKVHRRRSFYQAISSLAAALILSSCTGESPFLQVQLCVGNSQGVHFFKQTLQDIAKNEHMRYIDGSEATTRDLKVLKPAGRNIHTDGRLVYVGVEADGYGLEGGNLGLNAYDISVGFGPDTPASRAFSQRVVARLKRHWTLKVVPNNSGAFPDPECNQGTQAPPNNSSKPTPLRGAA